MATLRIALLTVRLVMRTKVALFFTFLFPLVFLFAYAGLIAHGKPEVVAYMFGPVVTLNIMGSGFFGLGIQSVMQRERGSLRRYRLAPLGPRTMLLSNLLANYLLQLPTLGLLLLCAVVIFHMPMKIGWATLLILVTVGTFAFAGFGLTIASVANTMQEAQVYNNIVWFALLFLSGVTFPLPMLPRSIQRLAMFFPSTYLVSTFQSTTAQAEPLLKHWPEMLVLVISGFFGLLFAMKLFRWEKEERISTRAKLWSGVFVLPFLVMGVWMNTRANPTAAWSRSYNAISQDSAAGPGSQAEKPNPIAAPAATAQVPNAPAGRFHHSGVYDETRKEFLVYGGFIWDQGTQGTQRVGDVWGWDGNRWQLVADTGVRKIVAPLAFDSKRERTLMFGGSADSGSIDGKLRSLEAGTWRVVKDAPYLAREDASLTYDSKRGRLVLFGGRNDEVLFADTWEYDGSDWKPTFAAGPSLRSAGAAVYDSARSVSVLYGGFRPLAALGDTWEWNGEQWKLVSESGPGPRSWPGLAYDSRRKRTVLFGGEDDKGHFYSDTWAWDGKAWTSIATEGPPARIQFAMAYDSLRDRIVVFGGVNNHPQRILSDLWEFDGTRWTQKQP